MNNNQRKAEQRDRQRDFIEWLNVTSTTGKVVTSAEAIISRMMALTLNEQKQIKKLLERKQSRNAGVIDA